MLSGIKVRVNRGFTLVEVMITVVIVAIGVALAMPTWENAVQKRNVTSASEELAAFIAHAQTEAVRLNDVVSIVSKRSADGSDWCLGAIDGQTMADNGVSACNCDFGSGSPLHCEVRGQRQVLRDESFEYHSMESAMVGATNNNSFSFRFDPIRGIKTNPSGSVVNVDHSFAVISENGKHKLQVEVSVTGRVRICSPLAAKAVPGYKSCCGGPIVAP